MSTVTLVGIITFTLSTYAIMNGDRLYTLLQVALGVFEKSKPSERTLGNAGEMKNHIIVVGAHRVGRTLINALGNHKDRLVVADFNPDLTSQLDADGYTVVFGDIADPSIQEAARISYASVVLSTMPDFEDNIILTRSVKNQNPKAKVIITAQYEEDVADLYRAGADYVARPYELAGKSLARLLKKDDPSVFDPLRNVT